MKKIRQARYNAGKEVTIGFGFTFLKAIKTARGSGAGDFLANHKA